MPLILRPHDLEPGMRLLEPVTQGGATLLPTGRELTPGEIGGLKRRCPHAVCFVIDSELDEAVPFDRAALNAPANTALLEQVRKLADLVAPVRAGADITTALINELDRGIRRIDASLHAQPLKQCLPKAAFTPKDYAAEHTAMTAYYTILLGHHARDWVSRQRKQLSNARKLSSSIAGDLTPLAMAALLMDVGMGPLKHLEANAPVNDADRRALIDHGRRAAEALPDAVPATVRAVMMQHHENLDGSGYPNRLAGDKVHVFSRIARIADSFDAATTPRPFRPARSAVFTLWEMSQGPCARHYDADLVRIFCDLNPPLPVGTIVRLTDKSQAVVVGQTKNPFRPFVVRVAGSDHKRIPAELIEEPIDLTFPRVPRLAELHGESLRFLYGDPAGRRAA